MAFYANIILILSGLFLYIVHHILIHIFKVNDQNVYVRSLRRSGIYVVLFGFGGLSLVLMIYVSGSSIQMKTMDLLLEPYRVEIKILFNVVFSLCVLALFVLCTRIQVFKHKL